MINPWLSDLNGEHLDQPTDKGSLKVAKAFKYQIDILRLPGFQPSDSSARIFLPNIVSTDTGVSR